MAPPDQLPFMSVVVCAYNAEGVIERALKSLLRQDYPDDRFEVIVVDDGSADRTSSIVETFPVYLVRHQVNRGLAAARNTGLAHMKGDIYVSFDDDCEVRPDWLRNLARGYRATDVAGIGSTIEDPPEARGVANRFMAIAGRANPPSLRLGASKSPLRRFFAYFIDQMADDQPSEAFYQVRQLHGATATFRADILRAVGGWDASLRAAEDMDLCERIVKTYPQLRFYTAAHAHVIHDPSLPFGSFLRRPYIRGLDTLRYYRRNGLTPPIFPFPLVWLSATALAAILSLPLGLIVAAALPQILYPWWPIRAARNKSLWPLLFTYVQLSEESATITGLLRGQIILRRNAERTAQ